MDRVSFSRLALDDLREIGHYTRDTWGLEQARRYRKELELALQKLSLSPGVGRAREELGPGVRSARVASHIAFYIPRGDSLTVIRLLHPSRDVERAFDR